MKPGEKYELFVYEKLKAFFPDAVVTFNDHIPGKVSGIKRQIDVSVRLTVDADTELLYVVQCKDLASPTDINVMGELASAMEDVGAAKGFLLCTSGFAKSNHKYAQAKGIELLTIEDIESDKWHVDVEIPLLFRQRLPRYMLDMRITANEALVERNRDRAMVLEITTGAPLSADGGTTTRSLQEFIDTEVVAHETEVPDGGVLDLGSPELHVLVADVWTPCQILMHVSVERKLWLKYLKPEKYSQIRDHVQGTTLPLNVLLREVSLTLDDSFVEVSDSPPAIEGLFIEVEEQPSVDFKFQMEGEATLEVIDP